MPERRTDRNGIISTRWVKIVQAEPAGDKKLPVPGMVKESLQSRRGRLRDTLDFGRMAGNELYLQNVQKQLDGLPEAGIDFALKTLDEHQDSPRVNHAVLNSIQRWDKSANRLKTEENLILSLRFAAVESVYEKYLEPSPLGNPLRSSDLEEGISASLVMSKEDEGESPRRPLTPDEADAAVYGAYAAAAYEMHKTNVSTQRFFSSKSLYWDMFQSYPELAGAFSEFRDRLDEATEYVYQNGADASALRQHMRGDTMALASGAL